MAEPRTIQGDVNGTGVVSYTLPPGVFQYVQSIRVEIDNTAGGAARPELDVAEQAGAVIATKRQGEAIPAGDTGSATWALRLDDEVGGIRFDVANVGGYLSVQTTGAGPSGYSQTYIAGNAGFLWRTTGAGTFDYDGGGSAAVNWDVGAVTINTNGGTFQIDTAAGGVQFVNGPFEVDANGQDIRLRPQGGATRIGSVPTDKLAFFGHAPAAQQGTPITLADVIALLRAYGLAA